MVLLIYRPGKKYIICIWCEPLIKVQQLLVKVLSRTYSNVLRIFIAKFTLRKKNIIYCSFKITFDISCCECTWFNFLHSKVYWWTQMVLLIYWPGKKYIICIWCEPLIKIQQPLVKVSSRTCSNISRIFIAKFTLRKKIWKCLLFTKFIT